MRRRHFIISLSDAISAWPFAARAQQKAMMARYLSLFSPPTKLGDLGHDPVHQGLSETGFIEGQNMVTEYRWAEGHYDRLPALAVDPVSRKVDLIVTFGGTPPALAAKNATSTIPIVFAGAGDPVGFGLVDSLARPGGNLSGFSNLSGPLTPKRLELLCELIPRATVIALMWNPDNMSAGERHIRFMQEAARAKGVQLPVLKAGTEGEIDTAFASLSQLQVGGLVVEADAFFISRRQQLVALASRYAVPATYAGECSPQSAA
jgi:putative ABC transport system substrate-binding protein